MTTLREAAQQALEALENLTTYDSRPSSIWLYFYPSATGDYVNLREFKELAEPIVTALRAALADGDKAAPTEPVQEPAGWFEGPFGEFRANQLFKHSWPAQTVAWSIPLYLAPPQRKPLTEEEIGECLPMGIAPHSTVVGRREIMRFARAIERAHRIE